MQLNIQEIKEILPHRYPFLFIDKVIDLQIEERAIIAQKNVTVNEEFFNGHFPNQAIMPGVLIVEAMAQAVAILASKVLSSESEEISPHNKLFVLAGIDNVRIKRPVVPGDILRLHATMGKIRRNMCKSHADAFVDGELVASADFIAAYKEI